MGWLEDRVSEALKPTTDDLEKRARRHENRAFWLAITVVLVAFVAAIVVVLVWRATAPDVATPAVTASSAAGAEPHAATVTPAPASPVEETATPSTTIEEETGSSGSIWHSLWHPANPGWYWWIAKYAVYVFGVMVLFSGWGGVLLYFNPALLIGLFWLGYII